MIFVRRRIGIKGDVRAYTSAQSGVTYTNGISGLSADEISEIAMAISNNSAITKTTSETWVSYYNRHISIGDTVLINVSNKDYNFRIIGFNHDDLTTETAYGKATATGKAGVTFQMADCLDSTQQMNSSSTNVGGWDSCEMRTTHLPSIKSEIDSSWLGVIKTVNKKASMGNQYTTINTSSDDLFLLGEIEVFNATTYSASGEGNVYAYWSANNTAAARIKSVNGNVNDWWLRSPRSASKYHFCWIDNSGNASYKTASNYSGVAFCFCV